MDKINISLHRSKQSINQKKRNHEKKKLPSGYIPEKVFQDSVKTVLLCQSWRNKTLKMGQCISPLSIKKKASQGNGFISVPCGKCFECLSSQRSSWTFRISQHLKNADTAHFVTLTYNDESLKFSESGLPELSKLDLTLFLKRLRHFLHKPYLTTTKNEIILLPHSKPLKYYLVGEYGSHTSRPHYHIIFFNLPALGGDIIGNKKLIDFLTDIWGLGHVDLGRVTPASIHYVTKYVINRFDDYDSKQKPLSLMSKGLGIEYLDKTRSFHQNGSTFYTVLPGGFKQVLPRYYKEKLFNQGEMLNHKIKMQKVGDEKYFKDRQNILKVSTDVGLYQLEQVKQRIAKFQTLKNKNEKL